MFIESARGWREFLMENPMSHYPEGTPVEVRAREWKNLDDALERAERRRRAP
jgi:hypothetical protein